MGCIMTTSKLALECPYCHWVFEAKPPDELHFAFSFERPLRGSFYGKIIEKNLVCQNPNCKRNMTIYWYAPLDYFDRI